MDKDILAEAKDAFKICEEVESDNREAALADLQFSIGEQWPEDIKKRFKDEGRKCLTLNRIPAFIRQVTNDARQNKPAIKVHPVDSGADVQTAKILDGLIRNIESNSNADVAYDTAIDFAARASVGYIGVDLDYACDDTFDLDIKIRRVANPFTVYGDPYSTEADSSDWNIAFETEMMDEARFLKERPDAEKADWQADGKDEKSGAWHDGDEIRIAKFWKRERVTKNLLLLSDGTAVYEEDFIKETDGISMQEIASAQGLEVVKQRPTESHKVKHYLLTGTQVLEADDWVGKYIPLIPVYGEEINVEGKRIFKSLFRDAKDAQMMFNFWRTASTELVALAPKAPFIGPKGAFKTDVNKWTTANSQNHPYIEFDGNVAPQRQPFTGVPAGALQEALNASDDMKAIMGLFDASLGARSNETSGKAIMARQREGDVSTFHFADNLNRAIRHTGRIVVDLIPHVYSGPRIVRVLGEDKTPQMVQINQQFAMPDGSMGIYDVRAGKYDVTVASGPSFTSRREEAAVQMTELIRAFPEAAPLIGDLVAKNLDWPGADEIAERLKAVNPALKPPQDPAQNPEVLKQQQEMKLKQESAQQDMAIQREQMDLQRKQSELDASIKIQEHEMEMAQLKAKHGMDMQQRQEKAVHDLHGKMADSMNQPQGENMIHPLVELANGIGDVTKGIAIMAQSVVESNQQSQVANAAIIQALSEQARQSSLPKRIIMDAKGKAIGVETVQ